MQSNHKAFTLIELLVVIAIFGILLSILLPSLFKAKELTKTAVCLSQQKQVGISYSLYLKNNKGKLMARMWHRAGFWHGQILKYTNSKDLIHCPSADKVSTRPWRGEDAKTAWMGNRAMGYLDGNATGSIGINGYTYSNEGNSNTFYRRVTGIENPSNTPLFTDNVWVDTWPRATHANPTTMDGTWGFLDRIYINRHWGKKINTMQIDNSGKTIKISNILFLDWHKQINYRAIPLL